MKWLSKVFNYVPAEERKGIALDLGAPQWMVSSPKEFPGFLRALVDFVPAGSIAYLEGGSPPGELEAFLNQQSVPEVSHVEGGTIWPRPRIFHIPATAENLLGLAEIAEHCAEPEVAIHFHVYRDNHVILQWFDAFLDPMYISKEIAEDKVREFCARLSVEYESHTERS